MTTEFAQGVKNRIYGYMDAVGLRQAGGSGFLARQISGTPEEGVSASFSDDDGVVEFGLLERSNGVSTVVLQASVVVDDEQASIHCVSDTKGELNFTQPILVEGGADGLFLAADFFAQTIGALTPATA